MGQQRRSNRKCAGDTDRGGGLWSAGREWGNAGVRGVGKRMLEADGRAEGRVGGEDQGLMTLEPEKRKHQEKRT